MGMATPARSIQARVWNVRSGDISLASSYRHAERYAVRIVSHSIRTLASRSAGARTPAPCKRVVLPSAQSRAWRRHQPHHLGPIRKPQRRRRHASFERRGAGKHAEPNNGADAFANRQPWIVVGALRRQVPCQNVTARSADDGRYALLESRDSRAIRRLAQIGNDGGIDFARRLFRPGGNGFPRTVAKPEFERAGRSSKTLSESTIVALAGLRCLAHTGPS
jgi:hypothetical protein